MTSAKMVDFCRKCKKQIRFDEYDADKCDNAFKCDVCFGYIVCEECYEEEKHFFTYEKRMLRSIMAKSDVYEMKDNKREFVENSTMVI